VNRSFRTPEGIVVTPYEQAPTLDPLADPLARIGLEPTAQHSAKLEAQHQPEPSVDIAPRDLRAERVSVPRRPILSDLDRPAVRPRRSVTSERPEHRR